MPKVFVSHSTQDNRFVEETLIPVLAGAGIETWYSRDDIPTADHWERTIKKGLEACDWFLVVLSRRSVASEFVKDEVHWAMQERHGRVVPVIIDDCDPTDVALRLARIQHVDFRTDGEHARARLLAAFAEQPPLVPVARSHGKRLVLTAGLSGCSVAILSLMLFLPALVPGAKEGGARPATTSKGGDTDPDPSPGPPEVDPWSNEAPMPVALRGTTAAAGPGGATIYVAGGRMPDASPRPELLAHAPGEGWRLGAPMALPRYGAAAVAVGERIYFVGGSTKSNLLPTVDALDTTTGAWDPSPPDLPAPRGHVAIATVGPRIYAIGGRDARSGGHATVFEHDTATGGGWLERTPLPAWRRGAAACEADGRIWVCGGDGEKGPTDELLSWDPATDEGWREHRPMPARRAFHACVRVARRIYVFGGADEDGVPRAEAWVYSIDEDTWDRLPDMPIHRTHHAAAEAARRIFIVGGSDGRDALARVDVLDLDAYHRSRSD